MTPVRKSRNETKTGITNLSAFKMAETIALTDSELVGMTVVDGLLVLALEPAFVSRSQEHQGHEAGSGLARGATLTILAATHVASLFDLPTRILGGFLRVADELYDNELPVPSIFSAPIVLHLVLSNGATFTVRGECISISLDGGIDSFDQIPAFDEA